MQKESLKGRSPFNNYNSPSPYQGEGDKGDRVDKQSGLIVLIWRQQIGDSIHNRVVHIALGAV